MTSDWRGEAAARLDRLILGGELYPDDRKRVKGRRIFTRAAIRDLVLSLWDENACGHPAEIARLRAQVEALRAAGAQEATEAGAVRLQELDDLRRELNEQLASLRDRCAREIDEAKARAAARAAGALDDLERQLEIERGRAAELQERVAAMEAHRAQAQAETAEIQGRIGGADAAVRIELVREIARLESRMTELEVGFDFFDLEPQPDVEGLKARAGAVGGPLAAGAQKAAAGAAKAAAELAPLLAEMNRDRGSIAVVIEAVKRLREIAGAEGCVDLAQPRGTAASGF
jgi:DNA repair exonuclease SbcCD ATPase subunit